jgi:hypothetical protein
MFLKFLACLVQEKIWIASLTPLTNSNNCFVSRIKFLFPLSFVLLVDFSSVHSYPAFGKIFRITGGFRNNFLKRRRLSESRNKLSEVGYWKELQN